MKQIKVRIFTDGKIESKTVNIKGKKCTEYIRLIQKMTNSQIIDSEFTNEFYESENTEAVTAMSYERVGNK